MKFEKRETVDEDNTRRIAIRPAIVDGDIVKSAMWGMRWLPC